MSGNLILPHAWVANDDATSGNLLTLTDAIVQQQGGTPSTGDILDFAVLRHSAQQSIPNNTWASLRFDTEDADRAGGHSATTNTERYTVVVPGWFCVDSTGTFDTNGTGVRGVRITVNGTPIRGRVTENGPSSSSPTELHLSRWCFCNAGQYIETQAFQTSGGALNTAVPGTEVACTMNVRWLHS